MILSCDFIMLLLKKNNIVTAFIVSTQTWGFSGDTPNSIRAAAIDHFSCMFTSQLIEDSMEFLRCIPQLVTEVDNTFLTHMPSLEEVSRQSRHQIDIVRLSLMVLTAGYFATVGMFFLWMSIRLFMSFS